MQQYHDIPPIVRDFLMYIQIARNESAVTCDDYYYDLRTFFRYMKMSKLNLSDVPFEKIDITDVDIDFIRTITLSEVYEFLFYLREVRKNNSSRSINRRISCLRTFFKFLMRKNLISDNPIEDLESPALSKEIPKHLNLQESVLLLESVEGPNKLRDFAILTIFLNCGLRLSELVNLNLSDVRGEYVTINGKGNKQRSIYLNDSCREAIDSYLAVRPHEGLKDRDALFISRNRNRISPKTVQWLVKKHLSAAGLTDPGLSTHKLRHTAATLMHRHGKVDVRVLQKVLGHENLGTTQIYTHVDSEQVKEAALSNPLSNFKRNDDQ